MNFADATRAAGAEFSNSEELEKAQQLWKYLDQLSQTDPEGISPAIA